MGIIEELTRSRVLAIVRYRNGGDTIGALRTMAEAGLTTVEVTTQTPEWPAVVAAALAEGLSAGVGTVTTLAQLDDAADAGARFMVSPGLDVELVRAARERDMEPLPGVSTATEILAAQRAGVRLFKLFPAGALGLDYLRQLRGPFPDLDFVPTGGIGIDAVADWLDAGAFAVAIGSDLVGRAAPASDADRAELTQRTRRAVAAGSSPTGQA